MAKKKEMTAEEAEIARLDEIFKAIAPDKKNLCQGLIRQAARLRVLLDAGYADLIAKGDTEWFRSHQTRSRMSANVRSARLFNARDKNYQSVIKLLLDLLPAQEKADAANEIMKFALSGKRLSYELAPKVSRGHSARG
jgi:hypothetical protein